MVRLVELQLLALMFLLMVEPVDIRVVQILGTVVAGVVN
jgi:hypothetical protein